MLSNGAVQWSACPQLSGSHTLCGRDRNGRSVTHAFAAQSQTSAVVITQVMTLSVPFGVCEYLLCVCTMRLHSYVNT